MFVFVLLLFFVVIVIIIQTQWGPQSCHLGSDGCPSPGATLQPLAGAGGVFPAAPRALDPRAGLWLQLLLPLLPSASFFCIIWKSGSLSGTSLGLGWKGRHLTMTQNGNSL